MPVLGPPPRIPGRRRSEWTWSTFGLGSSPEKSIAGSYVMEPFLTAFDRCSEEALGLLRREFPLLSHTAHLQAPGFDLDTCLAILGEVLQVANAYRGI